MQYSEFEKWFENEKYRISAFCTSADASFEGECSTFLKSNKFQDISVKLTHNIIAYVKASRDNVKCKMKYYNSYKQWKNYDVLISCMELLVNLELDKIINHNYPLNKHFEEYGYRITTVQKTKADNYDVLTVVFDSPYGKEYLQFYILLIEIEKPKLQLEDPLITKCKNDCSNYCSQYGMRVVDIAITSLKTSLTVITIKKEFRYRLYVYFYDSVVSDDISQIVVMSAMDFYAKLEDITAINVTEKLREHFIKMNFSNVEITVSSVNTIKVTTKKGNKKFAIKYDLGNVVMEKSQATNKINVATNIPNGPSDNSTDWMPNFDVMDGHQFEHFCAELLKKNGFTKVEVTRGSGDQGIDIIAFKDGIKFGIQCKCYSDNIGNKAVQEVFAGKTFYQCHVGIVLTNRYFTNSAIELAEKNGVVLWNREKLIEMINNIH